MIYCTRHNEKAVDFYLVRLSDNKIVKAVVAPTKDDAITTLRWYGVNYQPGGTVYCLVPAAARPGLQWGRINPRQVYKCPCYKLTPAELAEAAQYV